MDRGTYIDFSELGRGYSWSRYRRPKYRKGLCPECFRTLELCRDTGGDPEANGDKPTKEQKTS